MRVIIDDDYSRRPVPERETVHGWKIAAIVVGVVITIPVFVVGSELGLALGFHGALGAFFLGAAILGIVTSLTAIVGVRSRLSTHMLVYFCFGRIGGILINAMLFFAVVGWAAVTVSVFGQVCDATSIALFDIHWGPKTYMVAGAALMVLSVVYGFRALDALSRFAVPLLLVLTVLMVVSALGEKGINDVISVSDNKSSTFGQAVSMVVGGFIVGSVLTPNFARYYRNERHGLLGSMISVALFYPLILSAAAIASIATGHTGLVEMLASLGFGLFALLMLIFATWTSNAANYYTSGLALAALLAGIAEWKLIVLAGVVSTFLAIVGWSESLLGFLSLLGVVIPPICGVFAIDFLLFDGRSRYQVDSLGSIDALRIPAIAGWLAGSIVGYLSWEEHVLSLTSVPSLDSIVVAIVVFGIARMLGNAIAAGEFGGEIQSPQKNPQKTTNS